MNRNLLMLLMLVTLIGCNLSKIKWEEVKSENTIESYREYLKEYPSGYGSNMAIYEIDKRLFLNAEKLNTISAYEDYLKESPRDHGEYKNQANAAIDYLKAQEANTIAAYEKYLKNYPGKGKFSEAAQSAIDQLFFEKVQKLTNISTYAEYLKKFPSGYSSQTMRELIPYAKTATVDISQISGPIPKDQVDRFSRELINFMEILLKHSGTKIVEKDADNCDMSIRIKIAGYPKAHNYYGSDDNGIRYSSASISITIIFDMNGVEVLSGTFTARIEPQTTLPPSAFKSEKEAPYSLAYERASPKLFPFLCGIFGYDLVVAALDDDLLFAKLDYIDVEGVDLLTSVIKNGKRPTRRIEAVRALRYIQDQKALSHLIIALNDENYRVRAEAADALNVKKAAVAIEPLITALKDNNAHVRESAALALGEITGLTNSIEEWPRWWEINKVKYLNKAK